ncbi:MAG: hypothetical protein AAF384_06035 [Pseudomonadota bacterium]
MSKDSIDSGVPPATAQMNLTSAVGSTDAGIPSPNVIVPLMLSRTVC